MDNRLFHLSLILLLASATASASYIQMTVKLEVPDIVEPGLTELNVSLRNTGDEPAHDVQLELLLSRGFSAEPVYVGVMTPMKTYHKSFIVDVPESAGGRYPAVLKTHYSDANSYPFSTVTSSIMRIKKTTPVKMRVSSREITLYGDEAVEIPVTVSNRGERLQRARVRIYLPDELRPFETVIEEDIPAGAEEEIMFRLENSGALPPSTYFAIISVEYDDDDGHHTATTSARVDVEAGKKNVGAEVAPKALMAVFVILVIAFALRQVKAKD